MENFFELEKQETLAHFKIEDIVEFSLLHDIQIIRDGDYQYSCYIDGECYVSSLTPLHAMWFGVQVYKKNKT